MMLDKTAKVISDQELAFGIEFAMQFPENRSLAFRTACLHSASDAELKALLKRMSNSADFLDAMYRLRALKKLLEQQENELRTQREQQTNHVTQAEATCQKGGRHGDFRMNESQAAQYRNFDTTIERYKLM